MQVPIPQGFGPGMSFQCQVPAPDTLASPSSQHPRLWRTVSIVITVQLIFWAASSSLSQLFIELFIQRSCERHNVKTNKDCVGFHTAQKEASSDFSWFLLATGLSSMVTCAAVGVIADAWGRKPAMLLPVTGMFFYTLAAWLLPVSAQWTVLLPIGTLAFACGGVYAPVSVGFATLADVTAAETPERRTRLFALVEATVWGGNLVGPLIGGAAISVCNEIWPLEGAQHAFALLSLLYGLLMLFLLLVYPETCPAKQQSFSWSAGNPVGSLWLLATNRSASRIPLHSAPLQLCASAPLPLCISASAPNLCSKPAGRRSASPSSPSSR